MALFHVVTDLGSTFVSSTRTTYVKHGDKYNIVPMKYAGEGDKIIYDWQWVSTSLDRVDVALEIRLDTYRDAKEALFEKNASGVYIPRLRINIIRGIESPSDTLEGRILKNDGMDFSSAEYRAIVDIAHEIVDYYAKRNKLHTPIWETVLNWVQGNVISPANFKFLEALAEINPYFNEAYKSFEDGGGFKDAYEDYVNKREGIMAYLAKVKDTQKLREDMGKSWSGTRKGDLSEELKVLFEELGDEIQPHYRDAVIISIERVGTKGEKNIRRRKANEPHLFRGIYTEDNPPGNRAVVRLEDINIREELGGVNLYENTDIAVQRLKEICIRYGFPIGMMRDYILRKDPTTGKRAEIEAWQFIEEHKLTPDRLRAEFIQSIEKEIGQRFEDLSQEVQDGFNELIRKEVLNTYDNLKEMLANHQKDVERMIDKINRELQ